MQTTKRSRIQTSKSFGCVASHDYIRIWYTGTNTYSDSLYLNGPSLSKYSSEEKDMMSKGVSVTLKDGGNTVKGVILGRGSFEKMESLETLLEELSSEHAQTSTILERVDRRLMALSEDDVSEDSDDSDDTSYIPPVKKATPLQSKACSSKSSNILSTIEKENRKVRSVEHILETVPPVVKKDTSIDATNTLILAELRIMSMLLRKVVTSIDNMGEALKVLQPEKEDIPSEDAEIVGYDGVMFTLSSIASQNPCVFARNFLRKRYSQTYLGTKILCPRGTTKKTAFTEAEVNDLKAAVTSWFGNTYNWKVVVGSVNQFLRDNVNKSALA